MDADLLLERVGAQLRELRLQRGLTQAALAERVGLPRLKVVQAEAGRATVSAGAYARLLGALGAELKVVPARRPTLDELEDFLK
ncbi:helix-turn-helix transcriptional regulator [Aquincola sp. MAHUQ-54]|jgi:transcriptional regulator with XRE-family HTH domain|uniref:Helix-turn-helix transcriptional regulator n=1 Tax=Aquincola agrisoli TaxID=3119538 RepID=A0AAW9Q5P1_9BURK